MTLENAKLIVERSYKKVYQCEDSVVKVFEPTHSKAAIFNEALNTARVEETGLNIPKVKAVTEIDGKWALVIEHKEGVTLEQLMLDHPENMEEYMAKFVDLQLSMHEKKALRFKKLKDKLARRINE